MAWRYLLDDRLRELNQGRTSRGREPLRWPDVSFMIGVSRQVLQNLASNREMKVTNTRLLDSLCRFFHCKLTDIIEPFPDLEGPLSDDEMDRLVAIKNHLKESGIPESEYTLELESRPTFHIEELYGPRAQARWESAGRLDNSTS